MKNLSKNIVGATELRHKLDEIFDRVNSGQEIIITHRFKQPLKLEPLRAGGKDKELLAGLKAFDKAAKRPSSYDPKTPLKELYSKSIAKKYAT
ncbi:MAG TPA: type II toxin-antitoxin system prevent-host-death family antitoxin [Candidatus Saccharimonadales bacterium]|nr:type II toxin-antitoxin system prevent-host-death family antitoxin [Candidatus Saccharimonadales bacterium]